MFGKPGAVEGGSTNGFEGNAVDVGSTRKGLRLLEDWNGIGLVEDVVLDVGGDGEALITIGFRGEALQQVVELVVDEAPSPCRSRPPFWRRTSRFFG